MFSHTFMDTAAGETKLNVCRSRSSLEVLTDRQRNQNFLYLPEAAPSDWTNGNESLKY